MARLVVESGPNIGTDYILWDYLVVGRQRTCDVVVDDERISRQNTAILAVEGSHVVRDLGSRNGTLLNGKPIDKAALNFGDLVTVGSTELRFTPGSNVWIGKSFDGFTVLAELGGSRDVQRLLVEGPAGRQQMLILREPDEARATRFTKELERNRKLIAPHTLELGESGVYKERPYYVQGWCPGTQLSSRLFRGPLDLPLAIRVGHRLAIVLDSLHKARRVFYSLRPELIWLEKNEVWVERPPPCSKRPLRGQRQEMEWARYRTPEEARKEPRSAASDLYGLGLFMFHCLTGKPAAPGVLAKEVLTFHRSLGRAFDDLPAHVPAELAELVHWLLNKDLNKRPKAAEQILPRFEQLAQRYPLDEPTPAAGLPAIPSIEEGLGEGPGAADFSQLLAEMESERKPAPERRPVPVRRLTPVPRKAHVAPPAAQNVPAAEGDESSVEDLLAAIPSVVSSEPTVPDSLALPPVRGGRGIGVGEAIMFVGIASVLFLIAWLLTELILVQAGPLPGTP